MTYEELLDKWIRKLGRPCTAGEIVHDLRQFETGGKVLLNVPGEDVIKLVEHHLVRKGWRPVILCKDCRWFNKYGCAVRIVDESDKPDPSDYCAWGEEREDGEAD